MASEVGFSHVALPVSDIDRSVEFYRRWAGLQVVDRLEDPKSGAKAARLADPRRDRGFMIALVQHGEVTHRLAGMGHLGVGCEDRAEVDRLSKEADAAGCLGKGPVDSGFPLGYWSFLVDPDGHHLELSFGQNDPEA
jgi:catechol 2,3-dioxygenase-like lactoylglutathione lyase family enzyme